MLLGLTVFLDLEKAVERESDSLSPGLFHPRQEYSDYERNKNHLPPLQASAACISAVRPMTEAIRHQKSVF